jgi:small lipoprotein (TIGR04454 family)
MKIFLILLTLVVATSNCKKNIISPEECAPVVQSMIENLSSSMENVSPEEKEKAKALVVPVFQKECESGKYDLNCLKSVKSVVELQTCKK